MSEEGFNMEQMADFSAEEATEDSDFEGVELSDADIASLNEKEELLTESMASLNEKEEMTSPKSGLSSEAPNWMHTDEAYEQEEQGDDYVEPKGYN
ncbi:MAG: hypothetical protein ACOZAO_03595 [Patescibacteria group bacterium]